MHNENMNKRSEMAHLYALSKIQGIGDVLLVRILLKYGSAETVFRLQFEPLSEPEEKIVNLIKSGANQELVRAGFEIFDRIHNLGGRIVSILDDGYPLSLSQLPSSPPLLYYLGTIKEQDNYAVSIVGTRKPSHEGKKAAYWLAEELAARGITVISGLARGIDTAAHSGALNGKGRTIAVIGTGLDEVYPPENKGLWKSIIISDGVILSQFPPGSPPQRWHFPMRNKLMSGLAQGTVVVEAGETSGAKLQAEFAAKQGRVVFLMKQQVDQFPWAQKLAESGDAVVVNNVNDVLRNLLTLEDLGRVPEEIDVLSALL